MVRTPCCDQMGLKKGPWTAAEDRVLVAYIQTYGHGNWRALPKKAGLLRCGKSCRLRWINYLRPDIKRGNFTADEEDTIIRLHQQLGNRWSVIAAHLPGRTDNEIKNVWHTHLKKRLPGATTQAAKPKKPALSKPTPIPVGATAATLTFVQREPTVGGLSCMPRFLVDNESASSSSSWVTANDSACGDDLLDFSPVNVPELSGGFLAEGALPADVPEQPTKAVFTPVLGYASGDAVLSPSGTGLCNSAMTEATGSLFLGSARRNGEDEMDFWLRMLVEAGNLPDS